VPRRGSFVVFRTVGGVVVEDLANVAV